MKNVASVEVLLSGSRVGELVSVPRGMADEHTTAFAGAGLPTRKALRKVCETFSFLKVDQYIEQTLDALSGWRGLCHELDIAGQQDVEIQRALERIRAGLG